ncbi:tyrosine-type recombinase/integrase [Chelativorans salis]|uniref:Site-specific integrase n=1 Tax=Chelativorans salis TaxID=2978478 RepID=A0ABT2LPB6_9HYPH|nr:site-specific integrase [Chelativorans sp. EGI FJ00035]MCT7375899.1 site-specific integrase [Chelativorans sp. EGI FJ00035]
MDAERYLEWLQENIGKHTLLSKIDDAEVARLVAKRRGERKYSSATINRSVCEPLRAILNRARKTWKQDVQDIEWKQHLLKEPQERIREATEEEEAKLTSALRGDYAPAFWFAILSGCRRAEIVGLTWNNINFFNRNITVLGKGNRLRTIPMTKALYALLKAEHGKHVEHVFTYVAKMPRKDAGTVRPITMEGFKTEWRRARRRSGVVNFRFHDSRPTAATRLVRRTGNLKLAQKLLGHSDLKTTSRYAHVTDDDLRAGMEAATPTENPVKQGDEADKNKKNKGNSV